MHETYNLVTILAGIKDFADEETFTAAKAELDALVEAANSAISPESVADMTREVEHLRKELKSYRDAHNGGVGYFAARPTPVPAKPEPPVEPVPAKPLVYMASPYSHPDSDVMQQRFQEAACHAAKLMREGINVFSPITHTHPIAQYDLPKGWDFWKQYDEKMLAVCDSMIVLKLDGWEQSKGVQAEIEIMGKAGKPIEYQEPEAAAEHCEHGVPDGD